MSSSPRFSLTGKKAWVTGSSRGIGKAIATALAKAGASLLIHGQEENEQSQETLKQIKQMGSGGMFLKGDLSTQGGGRKTAQEALALMGEIDIIVLNASLQIRKKWSEITSEDCIQQLQTNFTSSLEIIQTLAPLMQKKKWGRILTVGSVQEIKPHPDMAVYAGSKAAQTNMVINLAKQLATDGVTVNNLAPGVIDTDRNAKALSDPAYAEKVQAAIPLGYWGSPEDCAGTALLLCSEAGRYITGQNIFVDGGMSL